VYIDLDYINFPVARPSKFIQVFHGNAGKNTSSGKNYSLNKKILNYDYLFCLSKEHVDLLQASNILKTPESAKLIGFIKLDDLVNQKYKRNDVLDFYKIDARLPTILYLPSYNQELSLNSLGLGLLNEITKLKCSFLIKLHPNSYKQIIPEKNITWGDYLDQISGHANIHHLNDQTAARYMAAGDILISDFGSSPTEFMTTGKPVIFYSDERANKLISDRNMLMMLEKSTLPFHSVSDCITQVEAMLKNPQVDESMKKNQEELIASRFYNPGSATQRARDAIIKILWG
jgi:CDP-glycerol glycerophosphotransferase (TagB/SpsB family)